MLPAAQREWLSRRRNEVNDTIPPLDKNLHASISPTLLKRMQQAAEEERVTVDEFLADAIERRLNRRELTDLLAFGKRYARARGLIPHDIEEAIAVERRGGKQRGP